MAHTTSVQPNFNEATTYHLHEAGTEAKPSPDLTGAAGEPPLTHPSPRASPGLLDSLDSSSASSREQVESAAWPDLLDGSDARASGGSTSSTAADDSLSLLKSEQPSPLAALDELLARLRGEPSPAALRRAASTSTEQTDALGPSQQPANSTAMSGGEQAVLVDGVVQLVHPHPVECSHSHASGKQHLMPPLSPAHLLAADKYFAACSHCSGKLQSL